MSLNTPAAGQSAPVNNPEAVAYQERDALYNYSTGVVDVPRGYKYRQYRIFGFTLPWYASPKIQLGMVAFVCFMCPGMFNALNGMGGGGLKDTKLNTALYSTFAVVGFFGGTFVNRLGVKLTLAFGGIGYGIYTISILLYTHYENDVRAFNIVAGVLLGVCAAMLWTAQGTIMISYPHEHQKGHYFAWFWGIFNMGAVIGSLIPLGGNINTENNEDVSDGTYIGFIVLMFFGAALALLLCNANDIIRKDGSYVILMKNPTWQSEFHGLYETIRYEPFVIFLFPMFFSSNWFYVYQQNVVNGAYFSTRTKALNSLLYWLAQIAAAAIWGYLLDLEYLRRSVRAKIALIVLFVMTFVVWGGGYVHQRTYTREMSQAEDFDTDWRDDGYAGPMFLYIFYGFYDAAWQATVYWFMGALSNSGRRCANYIGFYKGIQSAGAAISNNLDARKLSFEAQFISNWVLLAASLIIASPVIFLKIRDHVGLEQDLEGTDETMADVAPHVVASSGQAGDNFEISALQPATSAECCPFTYKPTCTKNLERVYHIKLFYNRKEGITPEQFNAYWANNHTKTAGNFHLRFGVYKYSQYHSTPELRDLLRVPGGAPVLEFDGAAEFWVPTMEIFQAMGSDPFYRDVITTDENNFIDHSSMRMIVGFDYIMVDNQNAVTEHGRNFQ
ncbi:hypothetical protein FVER53590_29906 [Fusarium verticillioides]|nr:hypothetical protein FVER53590_29906 [Fusarium verticillioides]